MSWPFDALASSPTSWNSLVPFSGCLTSWVAPLGSTSSSSSLSLLTWIKFLSPALTAAGPLTPCGFGALASLPPLGLGCRAVCWRTRSPRRSKSCLEGISKPKAWTRLKSLFMPILIRQSRPVTWMEMVWNRTLSLKLRDWHQTLLRNVYCLHTQHVNKWYSNDSNICQCPQCLLVKENNLQWQSRKPQLLPLQCLGSFWWPATATARTWGKRYGESSWVVSLDRNSVLWDLSSVASSTSFLKSYLWCLWTSF